MERKQDRLKKSTNIFTPVFRCFNNHSSLIFICYCSLLKTDISMSTDLKTVSSPGFHSWSKGSSTSPIPDADRYFTWSIPFSLHNRFWMLQSYGLCIYLRASRGGSWWLRADTWAWLWPSQGGFKRVGTQEKIKSAKLGGICFVAKLLHWNKAQAVIRWCFLQSNEADLEYQTDG